MERMSDLYEQGRTDALMGLPPAADKINAGGLERSIYWDGYNDQYRENLRALTARMIRNTPAMAGGMEG